MRNLKTEELCKVAGGSLISGESWFDYLTRRFPGGEWVGNSFYPNGAPKAPYTGPVTF